MKKDDLIQEAIGNIKSDRNQAQFLLTKLLEYIQKSEDRQKEVGLTAAKYLETLQRSNEQLVKLVSIMKRGEGVQGLSEEEKENLFDELNEIKENE